MGLGQPQITSTDRQHLERSTTLGNQGHENFVSIYIHGLSRLGLTGMVGTINIHLVHILDTHRTIEDY